MMTDETNIWKRNIKRFDELHENQAEFVYKKGGNNIIGLDCKKLGYIMSIINLGLMTTPN